MSSRKSLFTRKSTGGHEYQINRTWHRMRFTVPLLSPVLLNTALRPGFDDIEKTLQVYGIIAGLMLSCLTGAFELDLEGLPRADNISGFLYTGFALYVIVITFVFVTYFYCVLLFRQDDDTVSDQQIRVWWSSGGRFIFLVMQVVTVAATMYYVVGLTQFIEDRYLSIGFDYGLMGDWRTIGIAVMTVCAIVHVTFWKVNEFNYNLLRVDRKTKNHPHNTSSKGVDIELGA